MAASLLSVLWPGGHGRAPTYPPLALWEVLARAGTPPPKLRLVTHDMEKALVLSNRVVVSGQPGRISQMLRLELPQPRRTSTECRRGNSASSTRSQYKQWLTSRATLLKYKANRRPPGKL